MGSQPEKVAACNAPEPIFHAANFLHSLFDFKGTKLSGDKQAQETDSHRAANNQFEALLGVGCASFTVPKEDGRQTPSPNYHSIEGTNIYYLDWCLIFPEATLKCYDCGSALTIGRNQFKKQNKLLPILEDGGLVSWCMYWSYECSNCKNKFDGKDGKFLMTLPAHIRAAYPIHPTYATSYGENCGDFYLSYSLSDGLDDSMLSESNAHSFSKRIHRRQGKEYERRVQAYYSSTPGAQLEDYLDEHYCFGSGYAPPGAKFRTLY
jgi:hypothetical protein